MKKDAAMAAARELPAVLSVKDAISLAAATKQN